MMKGFIVEERHGYRAIPARVCCTLGVLALQAIAAQPFPAAGSAEELLRPAAQTSGSPARVRVKLDGFDLSHTGGSPNQVGTGSHEVPESMPGAMAPAPPRLHRGANQVGGASRQLPGVDLYAPPSAKAYALTPTFYWKTEDAQSRYSFKLSSTDPGGKQIFSTNVTSGRFTYPGNAPALQPGGSYQWSVELAEGTSGPAARGVFTIVGGSERAALARQLAAAGSSLAQQARIMFDGRIWFDALDDYTRLIEQQPTPELYRQRSALYDQVPATYSLADADMAKASE